MEHCRLRLAWSVLVALSVLLAAAPLQAVTNVEESERFLFWTGCSPLRLNILMLPDSIAPDPDSVSMGLTEVVVATAVRSRLRAARIYADADSEEAPVLIVNLRVIHSKQRTGGAFAVDITLHKRVYDPLSGVSGYVQTAVCNIALWACTPEKQPSSFPQSHKGWMSSLTTICGSTSRPAHAPPLIRDSNHPR